MWTGRFTSKAINPVNSAHLRAPSLLAHDKCKMSGGFASILRRAGARHGAPDDRADDALDCGTGGELPYIGMGRPLGGLDSPLGADVVFADGSDRFLLETIHPRVFEVL